MEPELVSTVEAAHMAGVAPSTIKRWADEGVLACVRTAGGHRRYNRQVLEKFVRSLSENEKGTTSFLQAWVERLGAGKRYEVEAALLESRSRLGSWFRVADELGPVVGELGRRWKLGKLTIAEEHVASDGLSRALARISETMRGPEEFPCCLLACVEGDEHTLGLSLAELCLREMGWACLWLGRRTPTEEIHKVVRSGRIQMVVISASEASTNVKLLNRISVKTAAVCKKYSTEMVLGGSGAWPEKLKYGVRLRKFVDFHSLLRDLAKKQSAR